MAEVPALLAFLVGGAPKPVQPLFLRVYQHLLPDSEAWRLVQGKLLTKFFEGLTNLPSDARIFVDQVYGDLFPDSTRELAEWEYQFGLTASDDEDARRLQIDAAWKALGGQSPRYLQDVMQAAGFPVYVHEWWASGPPWVARDPRDYTETPRIGSDIQCGEAIAQCGEPTAQCNRFLANEPGYIVNLNLTREAPPGIPSNPTKWPFFLYWGAETFGVRAAVPASRRAEFERLLLKICPTHLWLVTLVDFYELEPLIDTDGSILLDTDGSHLLDVA
jgi:hypothetical protein